MRALVLDPNNPPMPGQSGDLIICEEVRIAGKRAFRKGHRLQDADLSALAQSDGPIHAVQLEPGDVHEDIAAARLATALAGAGLDQQGPIQSRINLKSARKGLLRIDIERLHALNRLPDLSLFTLVDRIAVLPGKTVAGIKITPVATTETVLSQAEAISSGSPIIDVKPFAPLQVGVVTTEGMDEKTRTRFRETVRKKVGWYGGTVVDFVDLPNDADAVASAMQSFLDERVDLIMTGGGNTIDPLDAALLALPRVGGEVVRFGVPAHPGSMFWLAYSGSVPVFNLASCSMYSKATVADLVLPWIMAGERVTTEDLDLLGYGGLLDRDMHFRFPPYDDVSEQGGTDAE